LRLRAWGFFVFCWEDKIRSSRLSSPSGILPCYWLWLNGKKENFILTIGVNKFGLDALKVLLREGLATVKHRTVVQPLLWLCGTISLGCFVISVLVKDIWLQRGLFLVGLVPIALFVFSYIYFMFKDPDRLHSEDFQLKRRSLSIVESKGGTVPLLPLDLTTDPYATQKLLPSGAQKEDDE
jgi:hypothetical protein